VVTQALGAQDRVRASLRLERPSDGDVYVLTSDGVHDVVSPQEMLDLVRAAGADLDAACARMIDLANDRGGRDNATALIVRCPNSNPEEASPMPRQSRMCSLARSITLAGTSPN